MKPLLAIAGVGCVLLITLGIFLAVSANSDTTRILPIDPAYQTRIDQGYWSKGAETPTVTLLEYGDFQCPACDAEYPIIEQAVKDTSDFVQFHFRNYPLAQHDKAAVAAKGAEAAGRQGKFWQMYELLYSNQSDWSTQLLGTFTATTLPQYAQTLQLNVDQFKKDLKDNSIQDQIDKDMAAANQIPLTGTPTLQINGVTVTDLPKTADDLVTMLKAAQAAVQNPAS